MEKEWNESSSLQPQDQLPCSTAKSQRNAPPSELLDHIPQTEHDPVHELGLLVQRQPPSSLSSLPHSLFTFPIFPTLRYERPSPTEPFPRRRRLARARGGREGGGRRAVDVRESRGACAGDFAVVRGVEGTGAVPVKDV